MLAFFNASAKDFNNYKVKFDQLLENQLDSLFIEAGLLKQRADEKINPELEALADLYMGYFYMRKRMHDKAIQQFFLSESYFLKAKINDYLGDIYSNIGAAYRHAKDYEKSRQYFAKSLETIPPSNRKLKSKILNRLGDIQRDLGQIDSAFISYFASLSVAIPSDSSVLANNYNNLGDLHRINRNYDSSLFYYYKAINHLNSSNDLGELAENYTSIANLNLNFNKTTGVVDNITKAINLLENRYSDYELYNAYEEAIAIYSKLGIKDSLIKYLHKIFDLEKNNGLERYETNMAIIELEQNLKIKENEYNLLMNQNEFQSLVNYLLVAIVILIAFLGILLFRQIRNKKRENVILIQQKNEINNAKEELEIAYHDINDLNATKDKFFSIIAHDLRNPLGSFRDITKLLFDMHDDFSSEERIEFLALMKQSADKVYLLLDNLLEWSRSQRGLINYEPIDFNLYDLTQNTIDILQLSASKKELVISNQVNKNYIVYGDTNLINTILRNLISNAVKFTPNKGKVTLDANITDEGMVIMVKDTGVGLSEDAVSKLFRIDVNTTTLGTSNEKGSGLGLILSKEFVEMHKGRIWVDSTLGEGSSFSFLIPNKA